MNVFEYAKGMEKDGEKFYRDLAEKSGHEGLRSILNQLADVEVEHYKLFEKMEKDEGSTLADSEILTDSKNIFSGMNKEDWKPDSSLPEIDIYEKALDLEKKSENFYREKEKETENPEHKEIFSKMAEQEKQHYFLMENLLEFMRRPYRWLEFSEWNHLDEY